MQRNSPSALTAHRVRALDKRLRALVAVQTKETRRNSQMEELTGVPASQWASWWAGRARPSSELLLGACLTWPEFSLWLMTGVADPVGGQVAVDTPDLSRQAPAVSLLRKMTTYSASFQEAGGDWGVDLDEWQRDEINALSLVRQRELQRRLTKQSDGDQAQ
jgi:hypothetical protein